MSTNTIETLLQRLPIIEKARLVAWHAELSFSDRLIVNVDKSGNGTERFYLTHADIDDVYGYPVSGCYGPQDTDGLSAWGGNVPIIERDADSAQLEAHLDFLLRYYGIEIDHPVIQKLHPYMKNLNLN